MVSDVTSIAISSFMLPAEPLSHSMLTHVPYVLGSKLQCKLHNSFHRSCSRVATQLFSNAINRNCILRPAGVSACLPAPQPNGSTNLLLPFLSRTTSASNGNLPPPRGCRRPKRTKWLFEGVAACIRGSEKAAEEGSLCVDGSWQRTKGCREGDRA